MMVIVRKLWRVTGPSRQKPPERTTDTYPPIRMWLSCVQQMREAGRRVSKLEEDVEVNAVPRLSARNRNRVSRVQRSTL